MITYKFNKKKDFVETVITDTIRIKDLTEYILTVAEDKSLPKKLKILSDARRGKFHPEVEPEDLNIITEANDKSLSARDFICDAFIVSGSIETALAQLYTKFSKAKNYNFKVFSTVEAAEEWLNQF